MTNSTDIQLIDNQPENLKTLKKILSAQGYRVQTSTDGELALTAAFEAPPDLILLAIRLPNMDSYQVCRRLKADERTRDVPVLFLSDLTDVADKVNAFAAGGVDYITKPFQEEEVLARIATHLTLYNTQKSLKEEVAVCKQIQQVHRIERERFELALKDSPTVVFTQDTDLRYTWFYNPRPEFDPNAVLGKTDAELMQPDDATRLMEIKRQVIETGQPAREEVHMMLDGHAFYYDLFVEPQLDETQQIIGVCCATTDITARVQAEMARQESRAKYQLLFENANAAIILFDTVGTYLMLNTYFAAKLGGTPEDFIGKSLHEVFPDEADFHLQRFAKIIQEKKGAPLKTPLPCQMGSIGILLTSSP